MAIRNIVKVGDDVLTKKCRTVDKFDERIITLLEDMHDTLIESNGVGLAAPQVGVLKRIALVDTGEEILELINPEIISTDGSQTGYEGCLSYPGKFGEVTRPMTVTIKFQNRNGEWVTYTGEELTARAFCHEIEHLDGHMFMEKVTRWAEDDEFED
ncbi:MAG: peptide deformylase [Ruminococcaceae bacterium]|nr:peptide deformylase [Oscillospiraceae bacterium]